METFDMIFKWTIIKNRKHEKFSCWSLMNDSFGNYLIQKMSEICSKDQLTQIIKNVEEDPFGICKDSHGTRSIQKIIEIVKHEEHFKMIKTLLQDKMVSMSYDINGNHVIQKILQCWSEKHNQFIYDEMGKNCAKIACHKHGCCIM